jgi:hypothetical protein
MSVCCARSVLGAGNSLARASNRTNRRSRRTTRNASRVSIFSNQVARAAGSRKVPMCRIAISKVVWTRSCASSSSSVMTRAAASSIGPCSSRRSIAVSLRSRSSAVSSIIGLRLISSVPRIVKEEAGPQNG